ncbi:MAG TPA: cyclic nucleotide-binding domain-containing protein [Chloroflexota bacterium]
MQVRFWGVRGSIPTPGPGTIRYGGNTSCVEVRSGGTVGIVDCGSGARGLGAALAAEGGHLKAHLFISHFHWDHIHGFPFFLPAFLPGAELEVFGAAGMEQGLEEAMAGQMQYTYFPIRLGELRSQMNFNEVGEDTFRTGNFTVSTQHLNHTSPAIGYRLTSRGATVAYLSDHEPWWPHDPAQSLGDLLIHPADRRHVDFASGADLLIHDAQYTAEEYPARRGWGHSTIEYVVDVAIAAGAARLAIFHHDPSRDDQALDELVKRAQERACSRGGRVEIFAAAEGDVIELPEKEEAPTTARTITVGATPPPGRILILGDQTQRSALRDALAPDGYRINEAGLEPAAIKEVASLEPQVVLVALDGQTDTVSATRVLRRATADIPLIVVMERVQDQLVLRQIGELAADVVEQPFGAPNVRARVRACLSRQELHVQSRTEGPRPRVAPAMSILGELWQTELAPLLREGANCGFRPGEVLFHQGDPAGGVYYIQAGMARIVVEAPDGREVPAGIVGPGETVGEMGAVDGSPRSATVIAANRMETTYVSRETFLAALQRSPATAMHLLNVMARRLREADTLLAGFRDLAQDTRTDRGLEGQAEDKPRPTTGHVLQPKVPAVRLHQPASNR